MVISATNEEGDTNERYFNFFTTSLQERPCFILHVKRSCIGMSEAISIDFEFIFHPAGGVLTFSIYTLCIYSLPIFSVRGLSKRGPSLPLSTKNSSLFKDYKGSIWSCIFLFFFILGPRLGFFNNLSDFKIGTHPEKISSF